MRISSFLPALLVLAVPILAPSTGLAQDSAAAKTARPEPPKVDFDKFKFMAGCWQGRLDKDTEIEEIWTTPSENLLLATTRYLKKERATGYEFTRIQATDSGVVFAASNDGRPENVYLLKRLVDEYALFENEAKSFPQRIMYRLASDGALIPRNEGNEAPSIELRMRKVKCPGT
ncbi:MAG TPA: DUF6265 family protein [Gemmatimonadales bacterium]|nr:DUF6265 family protein [Gemmatimonadales bacterium]